MSNQNVQCATCGQDLGDPGDGAHLDYIDGQWHHLLRRNCCPRLVDALAKSLQLQSHYAILLNNYDAGLRLTFPNVQSWLDRLNAIGREPETRTAWRLRAEIGNVQKEPPPEKSMANKKNIDPANEHMVGMTGEEIRILKPPSQLTANQAMIFAAWLVALAEFRADFTFEEALEAVLST